MVKDTSKSALRGVGSKLTAQQFKLLDVMRWGFTHTRKELARRAGLEINVVCGRVNELVNMQCIGVLGKRKCSITGKEVEALYITALGHKYREVHNQASEVRPAQTAALLGG